MANEAHTAHPNAHSQRTKFELNRAPAHEVHSSYRRQRTRTSFFSFFFCSLTFVAAELPSFLVHGAERKKKKSEGVRKLQDDGRRSSSVETHSFYFCFSSWVHSAQLRSRWRSSTGLLRSRYLLLIYSMASNHIYAGKFRWWNHMTLETSEAMRLEAI